MCVQIQETHLRFHQDPAKRHQVSYIHDILLCRNHLVSLYLRQKILLKCQRNIDVLTQYILFRIYFLVITIFLYNSNISSSFNFIATRIFNWIFGNKYVTYALSPF